VRYAIIRRWCRKTSIFAVALAWISSSAPAQSAVDQQAPTDRLRLAYENQSRSYPLGEQGFDLDRRAYDRLWNRGRVVVEKFPLPERPAVELQLTSFELISPDARFVVVDRNGERELERPAVRFFRGNVAGDLDSTVTLMLFEGRVAGSIRTRGEEFGVGPRAFNLARSGATDHRVWNRQLVETEPPAPLCDGAHPVPTTRGGRQGRIAQSPVPVAQASRSASIDGNTLLKARIAVDATVDWYNKFGSMSAAQNYILNLMAQVSTIYETEVRVQIEVPFLRIHAAEPDPYTNGSASTSVLLDEMISEWNASQSGVARTAAHLFSVKSSGGSGLAYVDVLCSNKQQPGNSYDYGVSIISANGGSWEKELVAHEIGHNFSSPHTHCYSPEIDQCANQGGCYQGAIQQTVSTIMSYCNQSIPEFHQRVEDEKIRPAAEEAFPACIDTAGSPGDLRDEGGDGLRAGLAPQCGAANFQNDDGSLDTYYGYSGTSQMAWIKRFTPGCYPFQLNRVDMLTGHSGSVSPGRPIRLLVYVDPAGTGDPGNATLAYTEDVTVQVVSSSVFNQYALTSPVILAAGDYYFGFYDLLGDSPSTYIASLDYSTNGDSYQTANSTSPESFSLQSSGTFMIRGSGGAAPGGSVLLEWGGPCNDSDVPNQDFAVYHGLLGEFSSYQSLTCTTGRDGSYLAAGVPDGSFFLVVPMTSVSEGSYGRDSSGVERSAAAASCKPQDIGSCVVQ
jgi:hypothetical protein